MTVIIAIIISFPFVATRKRENQKPRGGMHMWGGRGRGRRQRREGEELRPNIAAGVECHLPCQTSKAPSSNRLFSKLADWATAGGGAGGKVRRKARGRARGGARKRGRRSLLSISLLFSFKYDN